MAGERYGHHTGSGCGSGELSAVQFTRRLLAIVAQVYPVGSGVDQLGQQLERVVGYGFGVGWCVQSGGCCGGRSPGPQRDDEG